MYSQYIFIFALIGSVFSHSYHLGSCPVVEPMASFEMSKFLGVWYVIQKTSTASSCITYNFTRGEEPGEFIIEQDSQHFGLRLTPLQHEYRYTGDLTVPDPAVPAKMKVKFPLSVGGSASFTVFMTDYDTYAGIFSCQSLTFAHRQSATLLSRTKTLDKIYVDKLRTRLSSNNVDPFEMSIVSQSDCPTNKDGGVDINIDSETFSAGSIAGVVRRAGEKIGDGIEYVAGAGKKIYHSLTGGADSNESPKSGKMTVEKDAEWLP